jgi:hypothetical protein
MDLHGNTCRYIQIFPGVDISMECLQPSRLLSVLCFDLMYRDVHKSLVSADLSTYQFRLIVLVHPPHQPNCTPGKAKANFIEEAPFADRISNSPSPPHSRG